MKPILVLDLTKLSGEEIAALRRDGFDVPPNIAGYKGYAVPVCTQWSPATWDTVNMDWISA